VVSQPPPGLAGIIILMLAGGQWADRGKPPETASAAMDLRKVSRRMSVSLVQMANRTDDARRKPVKRLSAVLRENTHANVGAMVPRMQLLLVEDNPTMQAHAAAQHCRAGAWRSPTCGDGAAGACQKWAARFNPTCRRARPDPARPRWPAGAAAARAAPGLRHAGADPHRTRHRGRPGASASMPVPMTTCPSRSIWTNWKHGCAPWLRAPASAPHASDDPGALGSDLGNHAATTSHSGAHVPQRDEVMELTPARTGA
jgi:hypothetical protein